MLIDGERPDSTVRHDILVRSADYLSGDMGRQAGKIYTRPPTLLIGLEGRRSAEVQFSSDGSFAGKGLE
jgi:hypothetical protein